VSNVSMDHIPPEGVKGHPAKRPARVEKFQEILFSLNIGYAVAYALFVYDRSCRIAMNAPEVVLRILETFSSFRSHVAPFIVHLRTKSDLLRDTVIYESGFVVVVITVTLLLYFLLRLCVCCWLYIVHATWRPQDSFLSFALYATPRLSELIIAAALLYLVRDLAPWCGAIVFTLHYIVWIVVVGERDHGNFIAPVLASLPLSTIVPLSGFAWLRYVKMLRNQRISQVSTA
jgi:hypothetical protein